MDSAMENVKQTSGIENDGRGWGTTLERVIQEDFAEEETAEPKDKKEPVTSRWRDVKGVGERTRQSTTQSIGPKAEVRLVPSKGVCVCVCVCVCEHARAHVCAHVPGKGEVLHIINKCLSQSRLMASGVHHYLSLSKQIPSPQRDTSGKPRFSQHIILGFYLNYRVLQVSFKVKKILSLFLP